MLRTGTAVARTWSVPAGWPCLDNGVPAIPAGRIYPWSQTGRGEVPSRPERNTVTIRASGPTWSTPGANRDRDLVDEIWDDVISELDSKLRGLRVRLLLGISA